MTDESSDAHALARGKFAGASVAIYSLEPDAHADDHSLGWSPLVFACGASSMKGFRPPPDHWPHARRELGLLQSTLDQDVDADDPAGILTQNIADSEMLSEVSQMLDDTRM
jgi:hypothetical protein